MFPGLLFRPSQAYLSEQQGKAKGREVMIMRMQDPRCQRQLTGNKEHGLRRTYQNKVLLAAMQESNRTQALVQTPLFHEFIGYFKRWWLSVTIANTVDDGTFDDEKVFYWLWRAKRYPSIF